MSAPSTSRCLTVVVPTRDRPGFLHVCLEHLKASLAEDDEIIVVDSASRDPRVADVAREAGTEVIRMDRAGASVARNAGWRAASSSHVAFVDDDVRVAPEWARAVKAALEAHGHVAFFTGRVEAAEGGVADTGHPVAHMPDEAPFVIDRNRRGRLGHSANLVVRKEALMDVDGFDEVLGAGAPLRAAEDYDLFDRLLARGHLGRYEPTLLADHGQWRTRRQKLGLMWAYGIGRGARLSKLVRADRARARVLVGDDVWRHGLRTIPADLRARYEFGVAVSLAEFAGTAVGFLRGLMWPLDEGRFRRRAGFSGWRRRRWTTPRSG